MGNFIIYNRHPQNKNTSDCMVRAVSTVLNKDYLETRRELNRAKKELGFDSYKALKFLPKFMKGYQKEIIDHEPGEPKMKLCEFANNHPKGTYLVKVKHHVVAVVEGVVLDTWDSTYLTVYSAWKINPGTTLHDLNLNKADAVTKKVRVYL